MLIPICAQFHYEYGDSPYANFSGSPHVRIQTGICVIPVCKWLVTQVLYPNMGNIPYGDCHMHMGIPVCERAGIAKKFAYGDPRTHNEIVPIRGLIYICWLPNWEISVTGTAPCSTGMGYSTSTVRWLSWYCPTFSSSIHCVSFFCQFMLSTFDVQCFADTMLLLFRWTGVWRCDGHHGASHFEYCNISFHTVKGAYIISTAMAMDDRPQPPPPLPTDATVQVSPSWHLERLLLR